MCQVALKGKAVSASLKVGKLTLQHNGTLATEPSIDQQYIYISLYNTKFTKRFTNKIITEKDSTICVEAPRKKIPICGMEDSCHQRCVSHLIKRFLQMVFILRVYTMPIQKSMLQTGIIKPPVLTCKSRGPSHLRRQP